MNAPYPACPGWNGRPIVTETPLHDDVLLALEFFRIECRVRENVRQHVDRERHVRLEHTREVAGRFDARCRVEIAADGLDCFGNLARGTPLRALERHMLEQMRNSVLVGLLVAAAGSDPYAERRGFEVCHPVSNHRQAGRKTSHLHSHAAAPSRAAREADATNRSTAT
jgi:hypothetical protein